MRKINLFAVCFAFLACLCMNSCKTSTDDDEDMYTVWTDVSTYAEFYSTFDTTLNDGMYIRLEFTAAQWEQIAPSLTSEGRHGWTKDTIKSWFLGRGFGDTEATKESSWLTTIDHGFIASRTSSTVYYIMK